MAENQSSVIDRLLGRAFHAFIGAALGLLITFSIGLLFTSHIAGSRVVFGASLGFFTGLLIGRRAVRLMTAFFFESI